LVRNGKLEATHGFFRDITEKKKALQLASEHERLVQTIFDSLPVCMYVKDASGTYLFANAFMEQTLGKTVVEKSDEELYHHEVFSVLQRTDADALNRPDDLIGFRIEMNRQKDNAHYLCGKKSIQTESGASRIFGFSIDVSELVQNTRKIESSEQMLQFIMNNIGEGLLLYSKTNTGKYVLSFHNQKVLELIHDNSVLPEIEDLLSYLQLDFNSDLNYLKSGEFQCERELFFSQGSISVIVRINEIRKSIHESYILISLYDNTKDKEMLHQLENKYNENLILIGEVHHRVKNNLAIIDGIFELKKAQLEDYVSKQLLSEMQLRVKSIALVHQKLYNAIDFSTISFYDYVQDMAGYYRKLYATETLRELTFDFHINKVISLDITSSISLGLLVSELVSNSLKYASIDGKLKIVIGLDFCPEGLLFSYSDSGPGITPEIIANNLYGFGFKLMQSLQKQLKGAASYPEGSNFNYRLIFPFNQSHGKKAHHHR